MSLAFAEVRVSVARLQLPVRWPSTLRDETLILIAILSFSPFPPQPVAFTPPIKMNLISKILNTWILYIELTFKNTKIINLLRNVEDTIT